MIVPVAPMFSCSPVISHNSLTYKLGFFHLLFYNRYYILVPIFSVGFFKPFSFLHFWIAQANFSNINKKKSRMPIIPYTGIEKSSPWFWAVSCKSHTHSTNSFLFKSLAKAQTQIVGFWFINLCILFKASNPPLANWVSGQNLLVT